MKCITAICLASAFAGALAAATENVIFENFESASDSSYLNKAIRPGPRAEHKIISGKDALSGGKSLEINTLGKGDWPQTMKFLPGKIEGGYMYFLKMKYKILDAAKEPKRVNIIFETDKYKRLSTEAFYRKSGKTGVIDTFVCAPAGVKTSLSLSILGGADIAFDDIQITRKKIPEQALWLFEPDAFKGMRVPPTGKYFLKPDSPEFNIAKENFFPFMDKFGQYKHRAWENKVSSDADFPKRIEQEKAFNAKLPKIQNRGKYFGLLDASKKFAATGRFRTQKIGGKWWLITPDGNLFWSHGIAAVGLQSDTPFTGRENYFDDVSDKRFIKTVPSSKHSYQGGKLAVFDFTARNLTVKYGEGYYKKYSGAIVERLAAWGINTCGAWSLYGVVDSQKTPYTLLVNAAFGARPFSGSSKLVEYWRPMPDFFEPEFELYARKMAKQQAARINSPYCIGVFVDNEITWQRQTLLVVKRILSANASQTAKIKFLSMLQLKYGDIATLNKAWQSKYANWADFLNKKDFVPKTKEGEADMLAFEEKYYERYFEVCRNAVKEVSPDALYLGCRFAWYNDLLLQVASKYCDVVSFNIYKNDVENFALPQGSADKPVIIGEFTFGNQDRGVFGGCVGRATMRERVESYDRYVKTALANPAVVGAHWFRWFDQLATGRSDGENYSVGFVDVCDTPIYPMVLKANELSQKLYDIRLNAPKKQ